MGIDAAYHLPQLPCLIFWVSVRISCVPVAVLTKLNWNKGCGCMVLRDIIIIRMNTQGFNPLTLQSKGCYRVHFSFWSLVCCMKRKSWLVDGNWEGKLWYWHKPFNLYSHPSWQIKVLCNKLLFLTLIPSLSLRVKFGLAGTSAGRAKEKRPLAKLSLSVALIVWMTCRGTKQHQRTEITPKRHVHVNSAPEVMLFFILCLNQQSLHAPLASLCWD